MSIPTLGETEAWIATAEMDRAVVYAESGRCHAELPTPVLIGRWKEALAAYAQDLSNLDRSAAESDLKCEIRLRGLEPPFHEVQASLDLIASTFQQMVSRLSLADRAELERLENGVAGMVEQFNAGHIEQAH